MTRRPSLDAYPVPFLSIAEIPPRSPACRTTRINMPRGFRFQSPPAQNQFTANQCWTSFLDAGGLRNIEVEAVTKMLACGTRITGVKEYGCDNPSCHHVKFITNTCHSRACPSCGKRPPTCGLPPSLTTCRTATRYISSLPTRIHRGPCLRSTAGSLTTSAASPSLTCCTPPANGRWISASSAPSIRTEEGSIGILMSTYLSPAMASMHTEIGKKSAYVRTPCAPAEGGIFTRCY